MYPLQKKEKTKPRLNTNASVIKTKYKQSLAKHLEILIALVLTLSLFSCSDERSASDVMDEFKSAYGISGETYTRDDAGMSFTAGSVLDLLYPDSEPLVLDYAIILKSSLDHSYECSVLFCHTEYDAMLMSELCAERIELIGAAGVEEGASEGGFVLRRGRRVVMCRLSDNARAKRIFEKIL